MLINGLGQNLPFAAGVFDQVVTTFPSKYIFDVATLSGIIRVLAPGGKLVVLPVAWIGEASLLARLAAIVFRITGQAPERNTRVTEPFITAGFQVMLEYQKLASSEVLIIIATKSS